MPNTLRHWRLAAGIAIVAAGSATALVAGAASTQSAAPATRGGLVRAGSSGTQVSARTSGTATTRAAGPVVGTGNFDGESPAVSSLPVIHFPSVTTITARENETLRPQATSTAKDPVVQKAKGGAGAISAPIANFDGMCLPFSTIPCDQPSNCSCLPPDTNGEAGASQYVEMVNTTFTVYSKTGAVLRPSTETNQLWAGTNSECATHNDGDPVVVYDQLAGRWLLSQFINAASGEQYGECIAVSKTSDATGAYYLYTFYFGPDVFYDYPHIGVWPDGYYMTANAFPTGQQTSSGAAVFAFERSQMLAGKPARYIMVDEAPYNPTPETQYIGQLPGDLDGGTKPPPGTPNIIAEVDDPSGIPPTPPDTGFDLRLWKFHVDWTNPSSSTFGVNGQPNSTLPVAPFVRPQCVYGYGPNCVPQQGAPQMLDVLGDRLMFRLSYRQFADHGSLLVNHTVVGAPNTGVRWYEVRFPKAGPPAIYQQGTYAPSDNVWRWMGSIAMDNDGNIGLGYSASGPSALASVRYTGRAAGDPLGQMTQTERNAFTGDGTQTEAEGRWGDYSDLTVDPVDDCTFWYAQEYLGAGDLPLLGAWRTRIVSFKFPGCRK
jgi:hypothetical protein